MKATEQLLASRPSDENWKALHAPLPAHGRPAGPAAAKELAQPSSATVDDIRRLMLRSQEFRTVLPSANTIPAGKANPVDKSTMDTVFACLAICADEERRAISFGSREGATAMQRLMHAIRKKFGISQEP